MQKGKTRSSLLNPTYYGKESRMNMTLLEQQYIHYNIPLQVLAFRISKHRNEKKTWLLSFFCLSHVSRCWIRIHTFSLTLLVNLRAKSNSYTQKSHSTSELIWRSGLCFSTIENRNTYINFCCKEKKKKEKSIVFPLFSLFLKNNKSMCVR